jgi:tripartite ATP-independent transporter DctM subunit
MSSITVGIAGIVLVLMLMAFGIPVGIAMGLIGFAGLGYLISISAAFAKIGVSAFATMSNYSLAVLPLFILMAEIIFTVGLSKELFKLIQKWTGRLPGGLAIATIGSCAGFAAVSASSIATAVTMGTVTLPEMNRRGYDTGLSTGAVAAGGSLGILIPPSSILIIYGVLTETSIGKLFMAGLIPGICLALLFMLSIFLRGLINPQLCPGETIGASLREKLVAFGSCGEIIALIFLVLGGLIIGWFTPTEAGAVGAFGSALFSMLRRRLTFKALIHALVMTGKTTGLIYLIMIGAFILNHMLAASTLPSQLATLIVSFDLPPFAIMACMIGVYLILGCLIDAMAMILLTVPIFFPIALSLGFNEIWFGIIIVLVVEMGMITPPVGINVYAISGIAKDVPMEKIFKGILPFLFVEIFFIAILMYFPQIALFLPNLMK